MRTHLLFFVFVFSALSLFAQQQEEQDLRVEISYNGKGTLYLKNGQVINGNISHSRIYPNKVWITPEGEKKAQKYKAKDVIKFKIGDTLIFETIKSPSATLFARCLTDENSKIKVYDLTVQSQFITGGSYETGYLHSTSEDYFVLFPTMEKPISIKDIRMTRKKVAKYVSDCPELSQKILNKQKGYNIMSILPAEILLERYLRIAEDYNNCKN